MSKLPLITLPAHLRERLAQGHPWVYRNHLPEGTRLPTGSWVRLRCSGWSGLGLWDESGPIALRLFDAAEPPDEAWLAEQVGAAWDLRAPLREQGTSAYRWLFGEGDGLPALTVDRYGGYAVLQSYSRSVEPLLPALARALRRCDPALEGIVARPSKGADETRAPLSVLWGPSPPRELTVVEHGLRFQANLYVGQKTGLFLDQRENRRFVEGLSRDLRVLNCFAYTGAFSLYALRGGARSVESVDVGRGLEEAASANIALNELDAGRHRFLTRDCFEQLEGYGQQQRRFDLLILDPPSFAKSKQSRFAAQRAYVRLNALALRLVEPGGLLASASCTSQVGPEQFKEALAAASAQAGRRVQIIHEAGQPRDHPVPAGFPEGRYLKFVVARVR
jgi:23S rRNA (cytosine1962-C5)-methyltransferase